MKGKLFVALAVVAVAVIASGPTFAGCSPASKEFGLGYGDSGNFDLVFPAGADTTISGAVIGHLWQGGSFANTNDLTGHGCPDDLWLYPPSGDGTMTIFGSNGSDLGNGVCDTQVCPVGNMIALVQTKSTDGTKAFYTVGRVLETPQPAFDYGRTGTDWTLVEIPRPRLLASSRLATDVVSDVAVNTATDPTPANAFHAPSADALTFNATISGYQLVTFTGSADPGRAAAAWTPLGAVISSSAPTAAAVHFNCSDTSKDVFVATRVVFDGGAVSSDYVSASTVVRCSNLANPTSPKIKPIGKKKISE